MSTIKNTIVEETQREAVLNRPHNLAGSVQRVKKERFAISKTGIVLKETNVVPALIKVFQEAIDNPIDVFIKSDGKKGNIIDINLTKKSFGIKDNGYGIPTGNNDSNENFVYVATCKYNTSSNYTESNEGQKGVNGIGIKLSNTLSSKFTVISDDGKKNVTIVSTENNLNHDIKIKKSTKKTGVSLVFEPDFSIFEANEIDEEHIERVYEYVLIQALTYPKITFKFNGKVINYTPKQLNSLFDAGGILTESNDFFFSIMPNSLDDFRQTSFVNGLETSRGGSHIDYIMERIVQGIREKLVKKYKTIKPGDIRNKLQLFLVASNFKGAKWDGQTKESITNPRKDISSYFDNINWDDTIKKILSEKKIIDPIIEIYAMKAEIAKRKELALMDKPKKQKPKSEKFIAPAKDWKRIFLEEGDAAQGSLSKIVGREDSGHFAMFGVPPNAYDMTNIEIGKSKKLADLREIVGLSLSKKSQSLEEGVFYLLNGDIFNSNDEIRSYDYPTFVPKRMENDIWVKVSDLRIPPGSEIKVDIAQRKQYNSRIKNNTMRRLSHINFDEIIIATDADLPGFFIRGQLLGLFWKIGSDLFVNNRIKVLQTPLILAKDKKEKIKKWFYNFQDYKEYEKKHPDLVYEYKKGLGSWDQEEIKVVIDNDGLEMMLETMTIGEDEECNQTFENWLGKNADIRKDLLKNFDFNINML